VITLPQSDADLAERHGDWIKAGDAGDPSCVSITAAIDIEKA
jgi:hypothetical protein